MAEASCARSESTCRSISSVHSRVENPNSITLSFDGHDLPPITFSAKTGQSGKKAHRKLKRVPDAVEAKGEVKTATKAAAKAVTQAVKTVSKEAVKEVSDRTGNGSDT